MSVIFKFEGDAFLTADVVHICIGVLDDVPRVEVWFRTAQKTISVYSYETQDEAKEARDRAIAAWEAALNGSTLPSSAAVKEGIRSAVG